MIGPSGHCPVSFRNASATRRASPDVHEWADHFSAQLGSSSRGRLRFANGVHLVVLREDVDLGGLYTARFGDRMPTVGVRGGVVNLRFPGSRACGWFGRGAGYPAEVTLNARVPWDIEMRGGASRLLADVRGLRLDSFRLAGGAGRVEIALPVPAGTVAVVILGGASNVTIERPAGVPARLRVEGGATNLRFDGRRIGVAGVDLDLQSQGYAVSEGRYDVRVTGGVNNVILAEHGQTSDRTPGT